MLYSPTACIISVDNLSTLGDLNFGDYLTTSSTSDIEIATEEITQVIHLEWSIDYETSREIVDEDKTVVLTINVQQVQSAFIPFSIC